jgi:hypothetical protein
MRRIYRAALVASLAAVAAPAVATADSLPGGTEGCVATSPGAPSLLPGAQVVYGDACEYTATRAAGYVASGEWRITLERHHGSDVVLTSEDFTTSCSYTVEPGDVVRAEVSGGEIAVGAVPPGGPEREDHANAGRYRQCLKAGHDDPNADPTDEDPGHGHGHDDRPSPLPPADVNDHDTWAHPGHPSYASTFDPTRADRYLVDEMSGCRVDHPYVAWLVDATRARFETDLRTMHDALLQGYHPLSPVPNDWGFPDTYWHWIRVSDNVAEQRDESSPAPWTARDTYVNPANIEWLLMAPAAHVYSTPAGPEVEDGERAPEGWVPAGALYYMVRSDQPLEMYNGCRPFHDHPSNNGIDAPHIHVWPYHHVNPMAFNAPHMCTAEGDARASNYPLRDGMYKHCLYEDEYAG